MAGCVRRFRGKEGVPAFLAEEYAPKTAKYCVCIPVINEGERILKELDRAVAAGTPDIADILICDGCSTDHSTEGMDRRGVNTLLIKLGPGKQGAQLRMGFWFALKRGYQGIITIDGNNKDSIEDIPAFIEKLEQGYDFVQGSRFIRGGRAVHTPLMRYWAVRLIHAPVISAAARHWFTDTTNAYRGYSSRYLRSRQTGVFRDIFAGYELLAYLSVRASQIGLKVCEIPVRREYPAGEKTPTKISGFRGNLELLKILLRNLAGKYRPGKRFLKDRDSSLLQNYGFGLLE